MTAADPPPTPQPNWRRSSVAIPDYDPIVARYQRHPLSYLQAEAMADLWAMGEDGWLREDCRFSPTLLAPALAVAAPTAESVSAG